jgi:hypothetical protein
MKLIDTSDAYHNKVFEDLLKSHPKKNLIPALAKAILAGTAIAGGAATGIAIANDKSNDKSKKKEES